MKKILSAVLLLILAAAVIFSFGGCSNETKSGERAVLPQLKTSAEKLYVIDGDKLTDDEYIMISSLQGITAQSEAMIFIKNSNNAVYIKDYLDSDSVEVKEFSSPWELVDACKNSLNGCVVFERGKNITVNTAATAAGAEDFLMVSGEMIPNAEKLGLEIKKDMTEKDKEGNYKNTYESVFEEYGDRLNKNVVIHQSPELRTLRDYAIAAKAFCFYTDENSRSEKDFREKVFRWANVNAPSLGWSADEIGYVKAASENGMYIVASDHCSNLSYLSGYKKDEPIKFERKPDNIKADENKHYIALIVSDGDNVQWFEETFAFTGHFAQRLKTDCDYKLTFTAPPLLAELAPEALRYVYSVAGENDSFICGVSGMGYINPTEYPEEYLGIFTESTVEEMKKSGLTSLAVLDNSVSKRKLRKAMEFYADNESVQGGFMQIKDKYESLGGEIIWCSDKPFISVRKSMWYIPKNDEHVSKEWIENFAQKINSLPADIDSQDGYSYINIHPWSMDIADVDYLVSLLDEHIEIVSAEELLNLVKENVEH